MLGVHVSKVSKVLDDKKSVLLEDAIIRDVEALGLNSAQIFTHGPQQPVRNLLDYAAIINATSDINLSVHSTYMTIGMWKITESSMGGRLAKHVIDQIKTCSLIGAWGLVLHVGNTVNSTVAKVMMLFKKYAIKYNVKLILEMTAVKSSADTYDTPEKINALTTLLTLEDWWGWCIDTAHLWGAGNSVQTYEEMHSWLSKIKHPEKVVMFHLNGSFSTCGSGKDKHAAAFTKDDLIWGKIEPDKSGVKAVADFAKKHNVVVICEINIGNPKDIKNSIRTVKKLLI
jgi:endonuclease IV